MKIPFISRTPGICGGKSVIHGTRIRVSLIKKLRKDKISIKEIKKMYPHLDESEIRFAEEYWLVDK